VGASPPADVREIVAAMARALDADDLDSVRALLADDCVYQVHDQTVHGPEAIAASYRAASASARQLFDEVRYESQVEAVSETTARVTFTDYLLKAGHPWHRYRCCQEFTVGAGGRIVRIVHQEIPSERSALNRYFQECGIER
jgi:ketosteroid isomerase-like protein